MKINLKLALFSSILIGAILIAGSVGAKDESEKLDLIFCIDLTGSMSDDIAEVQNEASEMIEEIADKVSSFRIAIVGYRDLPDSVTFEDYSFSDDEDEILDNINSLSVRGGGDIPEAVYEALMRAINTEEIGSWRDGVTKIVILMGDAPPHEKGDVGSPPADYKYTLEDVAKAAYEVDPANIYSVAIGDDEDAKKAFEDLADETNGEFLTAESAEEVPEKIMDAIEDVTEKMNKSKGWGWITLALIIFGVVVVIIAVIVGIILVVKKK